MKSLSRPVSREDFAATPNLIFNQLQDPAGPGDKSLDLWNRLIRHTPRQIYKLGAARYGESSVMTVDVDARRTVTIEVGRYGSAPLRTRVEFDLSDKPRALSSSIDVDIDEQGKGLGRRWLKSMVELSAILGMPEFLFQAGKDNGGFSWAKAGAHFDFSQDRTPGIAARLKDVRQTLAARLQAVEHIIPAEEFARASAYARVETADSLCRLARMNHICVEFGQAGAISEGIGRFYKATPPQFERRDTRVRREDDTMTMAFACAADQGLEALPLGRLLLTGTDWPAKVDFRNKPQMQDVGRYVGPWEAIAPATPV